MEALKTSFIDEEILYSLPISNFGVHAKNLKSPKNISMSFTPLSSNQKISFSNTIMIPSVLEEASTKTKNDNDIKKQNDSTKEENESDEIDEDKNKKKCHTSKNKDKEKRASLLEKNPYYFGKKLSLDLAENLNNNSKNEDKEIKKVNTLNNKNKDKIIGFSPDMYLKTSKDLNKKLNIGNKNKKLSDREKRLKSSKINTIKEILHKGKESKEFKARKSQIKFKTFFKPENKMLNKNQDIDNNEQINNDKNNENKFNRKKTFRKKRENSVKGTSYNININNNINIYKSHLFSRDNSKKRLNKKRNNSKTIKFKSITNEKDKKPPSLFKRKMTEVRKSINFEIALKNKNNLSKTQFNLFSPDKFTNTEFCDSDYLDYTLDCMELFLKLDKSQKQQKSKVNFNFPKTKSNQNKKIALFDLDETLVHCTGDINSSKEPYQHSIEIILPGNKKENVGINIRPFWKKTLNLIKKYYHIVVFTASHQAYADAVLDFMDPSNKYFKYRLYRNNCSLVEVDGNKFYVKDLDIFDEYYNLKDIIIIDNSALSFIYHLENGIPIVPYYNEDKDGSLYVVGLYLLHIYKENDLREANKKYINLDSFLKEAKQREEQESTIKEESGNNIIEIKNNKKNSIKETHCLEYESNSDIKKKKFVETATPKSAYFTFKNNQNLLINGSKLFNMFYEIRNNNRFISEKNVAEIIEEKSNKSFSSDDEEKNNQKSNKNMFGLFVQKSSFVSEDRPIRNKNRTKSNRTLLHYLNTKMIRTNFYQNFAKL